MKPMFAVTLVMFSGNLLVKEIVGETAKMITFRTDTSTDRRMKKNARIVARFHSREAAEETIAAAKEKWDARIAELKVDADIAYHNYIEAKEARLEMIRKIGS